MRKLLLSTAGIILMAFSCDKSSVDAEKLPLSVMYSIVNLKGERTNTVKEGENFIFSLVVTNTTDEEWYIEHGSVIASNFTEIYKKSSAGSDSLIGPAYVSAMCSFQSGVLIPAKGTYKVDIPWIADQSLTKVPSCGLSTKDNSFLPKGQYMTKMDGAIKVSRAGVGHEIPLNEYNLTFQIQ
ncbi:hypothetical protein [Dyadobacter jiangsuensis]|uniref:hypothetical protein n=1 Tax=Dyadobacter jiangsuensis TaxID=1591085 RepID=UPI0011B229E3|nr:hypothetical protein [Dyadobacter jiangsuensis]